MELSSVATLRTTLMKAKDTTPLEAKAGVIYQFSCKGCNAKYVGETAKTLKTRMKQHKAAIRNRYMYYLATVHSLDTGHQFAFDETQIIGQAQTKAGRLFMEAIYSDENSLNRHITLDPCYALIKDRLTRSTVVIYYKNACIKIYKTLMKWSRNMTDESSTQIMNILLSFHQ